VAAVVAVAAVATTRPCAPLQQGPTFSRPPRRPRPRVALALALAVAVTARRKRR